MSEELFSIDEKSYGPKYKDHLFEQYKMYVEGVEKNSDRRNNANKYFVTIQTAIIGVIGLTFQFGKYDSRVTVRMALALAGIAISLIFFFLIRSYKQLGTGKFAVIHQIEAKLPLALYKHEWKALGEGKSWRKYFPFSHIEQIIPWLFIIGYIIMLVYVCQYR